MMYTPSKYWPRNEAQKAFGGKKVFGILRDPFERLVAQFRGQGQRLYPDLYSTCNVNEGVRRMVTEIAANSRFANDCTYLPQAEFFEGEFGASVFIDNRRFPDSMNEIFHRFGDDFLNISLGEIQHVSGCDDAWAGDLDSITRSLVRQVYKKDFELLCKEFGYCDQDESVCLTRIRGMCPEKLFAWNSAQELYVPRGQP